MLTNSKISGHKVSICPLQILSMLFSIDILMRFSLLLYNEEVSRHHVQKIPSRLSISMSASFNTLNNRLISSKYKSAFFEDEFLNKSLISCPERVNESFNDVFIFEIILLKKFMSFPSIPYSHDSFNHGINHGQLDDPSFGMVL